MRPDNFLRSGLLNYWAPLILALLGALPSPAPAQTAASGEAPKEGRSAKEGRGERDPGALPFRQQPIDYFGPETSDAVAQLAARLERGDATLKFEAEQGFLKSLLSALEIPLESQVLAFSKSSVHARLVSPQTPRAIYFNDEVYVAWTPAAAALEISATDPAKGQLFYTLAQRDDAPRFVREESCLLCHSSPGTLRVPGAMVRSFTTDAEGHMLSGLGAMSHDTPFSQRWGGWYVTGRGGPLPHLGNLVGEADFARHEREPTYRGNVTDLRTLVDVAPYPTPHSDLVAHLVLAHQIQFQNLVTRLNFESRLKQETPTEDALLRYLFFADAPEFAAPVCGTGGYAEYFQRQGPRDRRGRSLRQLDLETRLPKFRLSYLVLSRAFRGLPGEIRSRVERRMERILQGETDSAVSVQLPETERLAIGEILRDSQPLECMDPPRGGR